MDYKHKYDKYKAKYLELRREYEKMQNKHLNKSIITENNIASMEPNYVEHLSEPWFTLMSLGLKGAEGRKNKGRFKEMQVGDLVKWFNDDFMHREFVTRVTGKQEYKTFEEYLNAEGLQNCLPGMPSMEHGLSVYFKYFTKEDEATYGVVCIRLEVVKDN